MKRHLYLPPKWLTILIFLFHVHSEVVRKYVCDHFFFLHQIEIRFVSCSPPGTAFNAIHKERTNTRTAQPINLLTSCSRRVNFSFNETVPTETFCQYLLLLWLLLLFLFFIDSYFNVTTSKSASRCDRTILNLV